MNHNNMTGYVVGYCVRSSCDTCKVYTECNDCGGDFKHYPEVTEKAYNKLTEVTSMNNTYDQISKPKHYNRGGAMECIDEMILVFGKEAVKNFCLCNWLKYRYRATDKDGNTDLEKSDWYIKKYKELCDEEMVNHA